MACERTEHMREGHENCCFSSLQLFLAVAVTLGMRKERGREEAVTAFPCFAESCLHLLFLVLICGDM